ncbi:MAG: NnrU family protein, partial [Pseudomonadota bacterium]|nr:NnrU family protein [Pseudomonadota bacterium]
VLSVKVWALAHLLANGNLAHVVLFGSFLVWAALSFRAARARDRAAGTVYVPGTTSGTLATVVVGVAGWALFAFWAHGALIGIRPIG